MSNTPGMDRAQLVALAQRLETLASDDPENDELEALLATFNAELRATCDRRTFRTLYQSMEPAELVDDLLARRDWLSKAKPAAVGSADELEVFLAARGLGHYQHAGGYDEAQTDVDAIAAHSAVPREIVLMLLESTAPAAKRAAFLRDYRPPQSIDDVWLTARALGRALWGTADGDVRAEVAIELLALELAEFPNAELAQLHQFAARRDIRARAYARKLGL